MTTPVVVQGTPVSQPTAFGSAFETTASAPPAHYDQTTSNTNRDDKVETKCNDPFFAVLFYFTLAAIIVLAAMYGANALNTETSKSEIDYSGYWITAIILTIISFFGAGGGMALMMCIPQFLIKAALIFSVFLALVWAVVAFAGGQYVIGVVGIIFFVLSVCYAYCVWSRIPFATANLVTAITAVRANLGLAVYAYLFAILAGGWTIVWSLAFLGVFDKTYDCDEKGDCQNPKYGILFVLFIALYFVSEVLQVRMNESYYDACCSVCRCISSVATDT